MHSFFSIIDGGLSYGSIYSFLALSMVITLITMDFPDLTIEGSFPFGAAFTALLISNNICNAFLIPFIIFTSGLIIGLITGILHTRLKMSKLLSGICVAAMLYSFSLFILGGKSNIPLINTYTILSPFEKMDNWFNSFIFKSYPFYYHITSIIFLLSLVMFILFLTNMLLKSEAGTLLRGIGYNEKALLYFNKNINKYKKSGLALGNGIAALAGSIAAQHQGFSDVNMGVGILVVSLVSVILGQELFSRLNFHLESPFMLLFSSVIGAIVYQIFISLILSFGVPPIFLRFFSGFCLVIILMLKGRKSKITFSW